MRGLVKLRSYAFVLDKRVLQPGEVKQSLGDTARQKY